MKRQETRWRKYSQYAHLTKDLCPGSDHTHTHTHVYSLQTKNRKTNTQNKHGQSTCKDTSKGKYTNDQQQLKRCSTSSVTRRKLIRTTVTYNFTSIRTAKIKMANTAYWKRRVSVKWYNPLEKVWHLNTYPSYDSVLPLSGMYSGETKIHVHQKPV